MAHAVIPEDLLGKREGETLEFKREVDPNARYLAAVVAFLNTRGGTIYFGVAETNDIATDLPGVQDPLRDEKSILGKISSSIEPKPSIAPPERLRTRAGKIVLALHVLPSSDGPHVLREGAGFSAYRRFADRNEPLSWLEVRTTLASAKPTTEPSLDWLLKMKKARNDFIAGGDDTVLRVAVWPGMKPARRVKLDDRQLVAALDTPEVVGVRSSGWTFVSSAQVKKVPGALESGVVGPPPYRRVRVNLDGCVEFTTGRDDLWSWHAPGGPGLVIDPFLLTEYPASVMRLAAWIHAHFEIEVDQVLVELVIRNAQEARLGPDRPDSIRYRFADDWGRLDEEHLCVGETGPLSFAQESFLANPDSAAFTLAREAYASFGLGESAIPFHDHRAGRFVFPE
jgi:hypothetical protein